MALNSGTSAASHSGQTVYYRGRRIRVTSHHIDAVDEGFFLVRDLSQLTRVLSYQYPARKVALISGGIELLLGLALSAFFGVAVLLGVAVIDAGGLAAAILLDSRRNPRWMELRATHRGQQTVLFRSRDQREFEQVRRAVIRAIEANRW
ncbi:hypothetical protein BJ973_009432 [Actinoplanes tereljensis]|uniref:Uncharacterized protein n=1 Tax=Paractinoplanes tereljensis TaxID=571912 RepID=A0A919NFP2_9ACTN|nr:DUF6232 family protein [Actinoplanes tereljensis]GIF17603.1 hypothetical protein Ate02nite_03330 [Actinoplanes tereljensis]